MRTVIAEGVTLIKQFEQLRLQAYQCPAGEWTIGYGHTTAHDKNGRPLPDPALAAIGLAGAVRPGMVITAAQAETMLALDVAGKAKDVTRQLKLPANDYQFAALVSLAFNLKWSVFLSCSVLRLHNAGDFAGAGTAFALLNKARNKDKVLVPLKGLTRRRAAEAALYMTPTAADEAADPQRTRAVDVAPAEQPAMTAPAVAGGGAIAAATAAKEMVEQLEPVRGFVQGLGLSPSLVTGLLAAGVLGVVAWYLVRYLRARREGRA